MAVNFTPEQQRVIDLRGCNILVSAAAGSGKTAVLVERIIQMVCNEENPVDIDRLLIVTFTNAAAAEMRERIAAGIARKLSEHPESAHIQKQSTLLHNAQITTVDSFCLFLLRNHFNEIGLDPAFRIADEGEVKLLQQDVMQQLLEDSFASGSEEFRYCVEYFCPGGKESVLEKYILKLSNDAASHPWPEEWLEARKSDYQANTVEKLCNSDYGRFLTAHLHSMLEGCVEKLDKVRRICEQPDGPYMYGELIDNELEQLEKLLKCDSLTDYEVKLPAIVFKTLPSKKDESVSPAKREYAKALRTEVKESLKKMNERFFATPLELAARQSSACQEPVCMLIDLVLEFDRRMQAAKQEKKIIDFSDMEHYALEILLKREPLQEDEGSEAELAGKRAGVESNAGRVYRIIPSSVALEYRQHFAEILIDEYQDSNLVQEYLLKAVSGEDEGNFNRFMVGDVKQSIYKFRMARPELFLEKYNTYDVDGANCCRIDLAKNFRSRREVVDGVNDIFERLMSEQTGGILYDERAALYPGASYPENSGCESELLLVEKPEKGDELGAKQAESLAIAEKIKKLKAEFLVTDKATGELRAPKYSDMVILLRTNSGWDEEFKAVLEGEGIPVYISSKTGYFAATEVQELLQFLRVLDNPNQDIPLFGVMKSIFGGFTDEEIAIIRSGKRKYSLYECLKNAANMQSGVGIAAEIQKCADAQAEIKIETKADEVDFCDGISKELRAKIESFLTMLSAYRRCTVYMPIRELLTKLVEDFDYLNYVTALPAGSKRRANVEMLFTKASDFEKTSYFGLFHFVRYIEQLEKYDVDYGEADSLDENADVVRIMSIHKSKGLEFPITFVAGMSKKFNMQDVNQSLILDMDLGLGTDYVDPERRIRNKTLRRMAIAGKLKEESLAEELRVLYVALTRAKEKLIMTGVSEKAQEKWEQCTEMPTESLSYLDFVEAGSYLDFVLPILPMTSVKVTVVDKNELVAEQMQEQLQMAQKRDNLRYAASLADGEAYEQLLERMNATYAHEGLSGLYTKTTVSELKIAAMADKDEAAFHTFEEKEIQPYIPMFRRGEEAVSGTVRGNAYHRVMEILDFEAVMGAVFTAVSMQDEDIQLKLQDVQWVQKIRNILQDAGSKAGEKAVRELLQEEVKEKRLTDEYYNAVNIRKITNFLYSDIGIRMWRAQREGRLYKEQPFVLGIDAKRLGAEFPEGETVLIQGIIDVSFVEEDGLVLLDYKTDSVQSMEELWNRYETQLDYYQEALQKLMQIPVKEKILYSFSLERY